ncbi:hypothetical protein U0C82_00155 [Fulvimarina sp. 2208YS6-2-32]|uniref:Pyrrolidone-carboxylate peptidase n=1 Tax=Fulvimarina uroteuthidis TaxID=3098149 RepID=A0ABU5HYD6_9HYPH|nr:hypothetical protein [Fulvimarina sp. 2208YS6-2-32]MDY8107558.1 hypothetical protein [Fulvimarina sp. 2208YS6-2-32]
MTTVIAGFAPFPGAPFNPSGQLVEALQKAPPIDGVRSVVLPVAWEQSWTVLKSVIEEHRPRNVLLFGLHMKTERVRLELCARNKRELGREDRVGAFPSGPSILDGPERYDSHLPWAQIAALLRQEGLDFEWSTNAGAYLCNDTLYRLAHHARDYGIEHYGFIHVPVTDEMVEDLLKGPADLPAVFNSISAAALFQFARVLGDWLSRTFPGTGPAVEDRVASA